MYQIIVFIREVMEGFPWVWSDEWNETRWDLRSVLTEMVGVYSECPTELYDECHE